MEYKNFKKILDKHFLENNYLKLVEKIGKNPERFTGIYRLNNPIQKMTQFLLTSQEVKFGNAMEDLLKEYLTNCGAKYLNNFNKMIDFDNFFEYNQKIILIEQKMRDDHDAGKKKDIVKDYLKKKELIKNKFPNRTVRTQMWFIDSGFKKNKKYYNSLLNEDEVCYGSDLYYFLDEINPSFSHKTIWEEMENFLLRYKKDFINKIDLNIENKKIDYNKLTPKCIYNILSNKEILENFIPVLSPTGKIFLEIEKTLKNKSKTKNVKLALEIIKKINGGNNEI